MKSLLLLLLLYLLGFNSFAIDQSRIDAKIKLLISKIDESNENTALSAYLELLQYLVKTKPAMVDSFYEKAISLSRKTNNINAEANLLILRGYAYTKLHEPIKAAPFYEKAYQLAEEINDSSALCKALIRIGAAKIPSGRLDQAIQDFIKVENIAKKSNDHNLLVDATNYLGISYYLLDHLEDALRFSDEALKLSQEINYPEGQALAYEHITIIKIKQNKLEEALRYCDEAIRVRNQLDDITSIASIYYNYSVIHNRMNNYDKAIEYTKMSIEIRKGMGNINGVGSNYLTLGNIYLRSNSTDSALVYLNKAYVIKKNSGDTRTVASINKSLSEAYERKNDFLNAYKHLKEYKILSDSVLGEEARRSASKVLAQQEMVRKENEIKHLQAINSYQERIQEFLIVIIILSALTAFAFITLYIKNRISNEKLKKINNELISSNKVKEKFFSIISHDLRSPFHPIISYSDFIVNEVNNLSKDEIKEYAGNIKFSAEKIYELLDNLLQWLALSTGKMKHNPVKFDVSEEIKSSLKLFENNLKNKSIVIINNIRDGQNVFADKSMVGIIIRNILSNAIKFTESDGKITLDAVQSNDELKISVSDTGRGISPDRLAQLFTNDIKSTKGTHNETGSGLGLLLCKEMTEKNGGKLNVTSNSESGTSVSFTLPLTEYEKSRKNF